MRSVTVGLVSGGMSPGARCGSELSCIRLPWRTLTPASRISTMFLCNANTLEH